MPDNLGNDIPFKPRAPNLNGYTLTKALRASLQQNFGDAASGAYAGPLACKYYSPKSGLGIVRCARDAARYVWGAATLLQTIDGQRVSIYVRACGGMLLALFTNFHVGTIKKVQNKAISIDKSYILKIEQAKQSKQGVPIPMAAHTEVLEIPTDFEAMDEDMGTIVDEEDIGAPMDNHQSLVSLKAAPQSENDDDPLSTKEDINLPQDVLESLKKSKEEILSIAQS